MTKYTVYVKTLNVDKFNKRSWVYEGVEASTAGEAGEKAVKWACRWWKLPPKNVVVDKVVSITVGTPCGEIDNS